MSLSKSLTSAARTAFQLAYVNSPIILTGGIADRFPGGNVPIIVYTQAIASLGDAVSDIASGHFKAPSLDDTWCQWQNVQGNTLLDNTIAQYPFANQTVAANALVSNPLSVSMQMICPTHGPGGMAIKFATLQSLSTLLNKHCHMGGEFVVITPGQVYTNMLLKRISDSSNNTPQQPASQYRFDFTRPLTQKSAAVQRQSTLMEKGKNGSIPGVGGWGSVGTGNIFEKPLSWMGIL